MILYLCKYTKYRSLYLRSDYAVDCQLPIIINGSITNPTNTQEVSVGEAITIQCDTDTALYGFTRETATVTCDDFGKFGSLTDRIACRR